MIALLGANLGLAALSDLDRHLGAALALVAAATLVWALAVPRLERGEGGGPSLGALLLVALVLRLPLLALPPSWSDDALRYLWDGRVIASGANPYRLAPEAAQLTPLRDELWRRLPHREVPTVYPPLALGTFSIAAHTPAPLLAWKTLATAADLAVCALLLLLARRRALPPGRAAWWALCPLVMIETAGMGHVDVFGVAAMVAAVLWLGRRRVAGTLAAAAAAAAGALFKLAPLAALPMWARGSRRPALFLSVAVGLAAAGLLPVALSVGGVPPGILAYGVSWEFNGPLYEPLWRLLDTAGAAPAAARLVDSAKQATGLYTQLNGVYPFLYAQFLAKLVLAAGAAAVLLASLRRRDPVRGSLFLFGALLLCSATVYPWYLLWVLPWAALERHGPWLLAAALAPLAYLPQFRDVALFPGVWAAVWGPPALLAVAVWWRRRGTAAPGDTATPEAA